MTHDNHPILKAAITGSCAIAEQVTGGLFLENIKMERQRTSLPYPQLVSSTLRQGFAGFEAGLWPWGIVLGLTKGTVLGYSRAKLMSLFSKYTHWDKHTSSIAAGFGAGAVQGAFMSPVLLARTRVNKALAEKTAKGIKADWLLEMKLSGTVLSQAIRAEGPRVLLSGMGPCVIKRSLDWGVRFLFIESIQTAIRDHTHQPLTTGQKLASIFAGGIASVFVTMPLDRLMPLLQAGPSKEGSIAALKSKFRSEGFSTMFKGGLFRCLHTGWHTSFTIFVADAVVEHLVHKKSN